MVYRTQGGGFGLRASGLQGLGFKDTQSFWEKGVRVLDLRVQRVYGASRAFGVIGF